MSIAQTTSPPAVWDRVVCGIDFTDASRQAALVAARLMPGAAELTLCNVITPADIEGGVFMDETFQYEEFLAGTITSEASRRLEEVQSEIHAFHPAELHLREGQSFSSLLDEIRAERATLVALGSHGHSRAAGIALGRVATEMLHRAPCSVLIAHGTDVPREGDVVVGFDGSGGARRALATGQELAKRLALKLRVIVATGDRLPASAREELGSELPITEDPRGAVDALVDASASAGLLIVGSRHLSGVSALLSVSERVAHRAGCPVLVVR